MGHRTRVEARPSLGWVYHWPRCSCGWEGDIVRHRGLADDQVDEHHDDQYEQPTLFD